VFERIATFLGLRPKTRSTTAPAEEMLAGKLESLLESTADAIVGVESKGCIAFVNPQTERLFGYLRHELLGKPLLLGLKGTMSEAELWAHGSPLTGWPDRRGTSSSLLASGSSCRLERRPRRLQRSLSRRPLPSVHAMVAIGRRSQ